MSREMVVKWLTSSEAQVLSVCDVCQFVKVFHDCGRLRRRRMQSRSEPLHRILFVKPGGGHALVQYISDPIFWRLF